MTQTLNKHVKINVPYKVKARKTGKWDLYEDLTITNDGPRTFSYQMDNYNGLNYETDFTEEIGTVDFSNTILPWKYDYDNSLNNTKVAFGDYTQEFLSTKYKSIFNGLPNTMTNGDAWKIENGKIRNGSKTYHVQSSISVGYIAYTPTKDFTFKASGYVSSEMNYDFGGLYIGTTNWTPTISDISSGTIVGDGRWLFNASGSSSFSNVMYEMTAGTTYYIIFAYGKDGGVDTGEDSFVVTDCNLELEYPSMIQGCLHHYNDTTKQAVALNAFVIDGNDRIILSDLNITRDDLYYRIYHKYRKPAVGYKELAYIETDGHQYINTGYYHNSSTTKYEGKYQITGFVNQYHTFVGSRTTDTSEDAYYVGFTSSETYGCIGGNKTQNVSLSLSLNTDVIFRTDPNAGWYFNDRLISCVHQTETLGSYPTYLLALNQQNSIIETFSGKLYYFKIYENDVLIYDFIPVERMEDGAIGLYDKINGVFYGNSGSGIFKHGECFIEDGTAEDYDYYDEVTFDSVDYLGTVNIPKHTDMIVDLDDFEYTQLGDAYKLTEYKGESEDLTFVTEGAL